MDVDGEDGRSDVVVVAVAAVIVVRVEGRKRKQEERGREEKTFIYLSLRRCGSLTWSCDVP